MEEQRKSIIDQEDEEDVEAIMEEILNDPVINNLQVPYEMKERIFAKIREYEAQRVELNLVDFKDCEI